MSRMVGQPEANFWRNLDSTLNLEFGKVVYECAVIRAQSFTSMYPESLGITMANAKRTKTSPKRGLRPQVLSSDQGAMNEWWKTFFDLEYLRIWGQMFTEDANAKQAADLW